MIWSPVFLKIWWLVYFPELSWNKHGPRHFHKFHHLFLSDPIEKWDQYLQLSNHILTRCSEGILQIFVQKIWRKPLISTQICFLHIGFTLGPEKPNFLLGFHKWHNLHILIFHVLTFLSTCQNIVSSKKMRKEKFLSILKKKYFFLSQIFF